MTFRRFFLEIIICKKAVPTARLRLKDSFLHGTNPIKST